MEMMNHFMTLIQQPRIRSHPILSIVKANRKQRSDLSETLKMESKSKRPTCPNCSKPTRFCLCKRFQNLGLDNPVSVIVLQHSLERKHALNSVRIAQLGLKNLNVTTVSDVDSIAEFVIRVMESDSALVLNPNKSGMEGENCLNLSIPFDDEGYKLGLVDADDLGLERSVKSLDETRAGVVDDQEFHRKRQKFIDSTNSFVETESINSVQKLVELNFQHELVVEAEKTDARCINRIHSDTQNPSINIVINKQGVISHVSHSLILETREQKPNLDGILASKFIMEALEKGFVVTKFSEEHEEFVLDVSPGSVLLFPSEESVSVSDLKATGFKPKNLIILDGTWAKAKRMYMENPWLKLLPHLKLDIDERSLYGEVRRQPKAGCLSTIESIIYAMKEIGEYPEGIDDLLDVFESMVEDQRRCKDERLSQSFQS